MDELYDDLFDEKYTEPWKNTACLGYVISALENLGYAPDKITEIVMELTELFDWFTVGDADEAFTDSDYYETYL